MSNNSSSTSHKTTSTTNTSYTITSTASTSHTPHACAACRYQRRKCAPNCLLAPYFPAHNQRQFLNAHKLFGVNNIVKTLKSVAPHQRDDAMTALIYTANVRANDPVGGCTRIVTDLELKVAQTEAELDLVLAEIEALRVHKEAFYGRVNGANIEVGSSSGSSVWFGQEGVDCMVHEGQALYGYREPICRHSDSKGVRHIKTEGLACSGGNGS